MARKSSPQTLPNGWRVALDHTVRVADGGYTLIGGEMTRGVVLSESSAQHLTDRSIVVSDDTSRKLAATLTDYGMAHPDVSGPTHIGDPWRDDITVVIPVYERVHALDRALTAIGGRAPVIVVDDGSPNPAKLQEVCERHGARSHRQERNRGPAAARNIGIGLVTTSLVMVVDSDIEVVDGVWNLARHFADPRVGIVAPRIRAHSTARVPAILAHYENTHHSPDRGPHPGLVSPWGRVGWIPSACFLARRNALGNGFDEGMRVGEDVDLVWRVVDEGWLVRYDPSAEVKHAVSDRAGDWLIRRFTYGTSAGTLGVHHPTHMTPAVFTPTSLAITLLIATLKPWPAIAAGVLAWAKADTATARLAPSDAALDATAASAGRAVWGPAKQASALVLRHWFPLTLVLMPFSRHVRRLVVASLVVDTVASRRALQTLPGELKKHPISVAKRVLGFLVMRRIDDAGYGTGAWWGAITSGSLRSVMPRFIRRSGKASGEGRANSSMAPPRGG